MRQLTFMIFTALLCLGFAIGDVSWVYAQETEEFTLEEITVTAQKREEDLQKVAMTVEIITGDELTEMGMINLQDALRGVSQAVVQKAGRELSVIIRGMDNDSMPNESFSQVAVVLDGSFSTAIGIGQSGLYDMQRIEVLAGPQGTLYSRNSAGGVVNMISNEPGREKIEGSGSIEMGTYHLMNVQGMLNVPINDKVAFRTAFNSTRHEAYISNGTDDDDTKSARLKLGYYPSDDISVVLTYEYAHSGGKGAAGGVEPFESEDDVENPWIRNLSGDLYLTDRLNQRAFINLQWSTPIGTLTFLPSYMKTNMFEIQSSELSIGGGGPGSVGLGVYRPEHMPGHAKEVSTELRLASSVDFFMKYLIGLYYYNRCQYGSFSADSMEYNGAVFPSTYGYKNQENPSKAVFGNVTYPVSDEFRMTVGGRYTADKEHFSSLSDRGSSDERFESSHFDYKLAVEYDLGEDSMIWADYSTGYKHVFRNAAAQHLKSYQLGIKSRFLDQKLQINATPFYYDYSNFEIRGGTITVGGVNYMGRGVGDATIYGLDLATDYIVSAKDRINLSFSYLEATVSNVLMKYSDMTGYVYSTESMFGGTALNNSPKLSITVSYEHRFNLSSGGSLTARLDPRYQTKTILVSFPDGRGLPAGMDVNKVNEEPNHFMANASLNYYNASGKWSLHGYIKNITNHAEKTGLLGGELRIAAPRTYGAVISVRF